MLNKINRSWVILVGAVVFGGLAVFASSRYIQQTISAERAKLNPQVAMVDVVVAKAELERGTNIGSENMAVRQVPSEFVPGTAVTPEQFANVEGARLAVDMRAGEILLRGTLEGADTATFATKVRDGVRAMTVAVDEVNSISGMLQPGIASTCSSPRARRCGQAAAAAEQTLVLMQNVSLLATGRRCARASARTASRARHVRIPPSRSRPRRVMRSAVSSRRSRARSTAVLRGPEDKEPLVATAMDSRDPVRMRLLVRVASSPARPPRVEVIIGGQGGKAERELIAIAPFLAPAPRRRRCRPPRRSTRNAANAISQLLRAASPPDECALNLKPGMTSSKEKHVPA